MSGYSPFRGPLLFKCSNGDGLLLWPSCFLCALACWALLCCFAIAAHASWPRTSHGATLSQACGLGASSCQGAAGFIGYSIARQLLQQNETVVGMDNFDPFYDVDLKFHRNRLLKRFEQYRFYRGGLISHYHCNVSRCLQPEPALGALCCPQVPAIVLLMLTSQNYPCCASRGQGWRACLARAPARLCGGKYWLLRCAPKRPCEVGRWVLLTARVNRRIDVVFASSSSVYGTSAPLPLSPQ